MKVVVLAGGLGTRLSEETGTKPKPMVEVGGKPLLWHILNTYSAAGFNDFVVALGYKGDMIKDYFLNYWTRSSNFTVDLQTGQTTVHGGSTLSWKVTLVDTGEHTQTGGRIKRLQPWLGSEPFMMTYGDGVSDVNINELVAFHRSRGKIATVTAVRPPARFGQLIFDGDTVTEFSEKPQVGEGWINCGFMVLQPEVFGYIKDDETALEREPLERLAIDGQLVAYRHEGFWQPMDTLRDVRALEHLWASGKAPWRI